MTDDLAFLPAWYAQEGDCVFIDGQAPLPFFSRLPDGIRAPARPLARKEIEANAASLPRMEAAPWGLSPQSIHLFNELKRRYGLDIGVPVWKDEYTGLTSRRTAAACLAEIKRRLPGTAFPRPPVFFSEWEAAEDWLQQHPGAFVLKTPYSSSGRGLLWLDENRLSDSDRKRIKGILRKQGSVSLERALDKVVDFAMEFYSDGRGNIRYEGLSLFETNSRGAYRGNRLQSQSAHEKELLKYAGKDTLNRIEQTVAHVLRDTFGARYTGYLGVDMLVYRDEEAFGIHPCLEINLRYTMGMAAIRIFENYFGEGAEGIFNILYENDSRRAYGQHLLMEKAYPPVLKDGRLHEGYLSLCPVTEETHYIAYVLAASEKNRIFRL
jgi:hypothetical protein